MSLVEVSELGWKVCPSSSFFVSALMICDRGSRGMWYISTTTRGRIKDVAVEFVAPTGYRPESEPFSRRDIGKDRESVCSIASTPSLSKETSSSKISESSQSTPPQSPPSYRRRSIADGTQQFARGKAEALTSTLEQDRRMPKSSNAKATSKRFPSRKMSLPL